MNDDSEIQHFALRVARFLVVPAWGGFIYTLLHRPIHVGFGAATASLPEVGALTVGSLFIGLLCFLASLAGSRGDASFSAWGFVIVCAIPFFGMVSLLDPFGVTSSVAR